MKKKSERFVPLKNLAKNSEDSAARQLGLSRQALLQYQSRLVELSNFRAEYMQQMHQAGNNGMNGQQLQSFQQFISQLDLAIAQQKQRIEVAKVNCQNHNMHWQEKHRRTEILNKTIKRLKTQEQRVQQRKEQREEDEFSHNIKASELL